MGKITRLFKTGNYPFCSLFLLALFFLCSVQAISNEASSPIKLFNKNGGTVAGYDTIVSNLKEGDNLLLGDNIYTLDSFKDSGNRTLVLGLAPPKQNFVLRIPLRSNTVEGFNSWVDGQKILKKTGMRVPELEKFVSHNFAVVERINKANVGSSSNLNDVLRDIPDTTLRKQAKLELPDFLKSVARYNAIADLHPRQLAFDPEKGWVLLDFGDGVSIKLSDPAQPGNTQVEITNEDGNFRSFEDIMINQLSVEELRRNRKAYNHIFDYYKNSKFSNGEASFLAKFLASDPNPSEEIDKWVLDQYIRNGAFDVDAKNFYWTNSNRRKPIPREAAVALVKDLFISYNNLSTIGRLKLRQIILNPKTKFLGAEDAELFRTVFAEQVNKMEKSFYTHPFYEELPQKSKDQLFALLQKQGAPNPPIKQRLIHQLNRLVQGCKKLF